MRQDLLGWAGFTVDNWQVAAQFAGTHKIDLDEALVWADKAIYEPFRGAVPGRDDFSTRQTKAVVLRAMGRDGDADTVMDRAIRLPGTQSADVYRYAMGILSSGKKDRAMEILQLNRRLHPDERFWTYLGLARANAAAGDKKNAITNWEIALRNVPANQAANVPAFQKALQALKDSA
jgi:predicted Zn-dependent protease